MASVRYTLGRVFDPDDAANFGLNSYSNSAAQYRITVGEFGRDIALGLENLTTDDGNSLLLTRQPIVSINADFSDNTGPVELNGGSYADILRGGINDDVLNGGAGNDVLEGGAGGDSFNGGDGSDTVSYEHSTTGVLIALDTGSADRNDAEGDVYDSVENARGGSGDDLLIGGFVRGFLEGGGGADELADIYGTGMFASYQHSSLGVNINLNLQTQSDGSTDADGDRLVGIVNLLGSANNDSLTGDSQGNILDGGAGADTLTGLTGNDTYFVDNAGDVVIEGEAAGNDIIQSSISYTLTDTQFIENLRLVNATGNAELDLTGNSFANRLIGNGGANELDGGAGADRLEGGRGNDTYYVDDAGDVVIEFAGGGNDTVLVDTGLLSYALQQTRHVETLRAEDSTATTALKLYGNGFANTLIGNAGDNVLNGRGGGDTLEGGAGDDIHYVTGGDRVVEAAGEAGGNDSLIALTSYQLNGGAAVETLRLVSTLEGPSTLMGNEFDQRLVGNAGDNVLDGGFGNDVLQGGAGNDTFRFSSTLGAGNVDQIRDFTIGQDAFRLQFDFAFQLRDGNGGLRDGVFADITNGTDDVTQDTRLLYSAKTGVLSYDADGSGTGAAIDFAVLDNRAGITEADFVFPV